MNTASDKRPPAKMNDVDLALLGKTPVEADNATGHDAKDDADFDELQTEVQKAVSVFNGDAANWEKIIDLSSHILSMKSKDMVVAGYLAVGLIHCRGLEGFVIGSGVYMDLVENYWDDLFPAKTRPVGRSRAIAWWIEKTLTALKALGPVTLPLRQSEALARRFEETSLILKTELEDCPSFRPIIEWISGAEVSSPSEIKPTAEKANGVLEAPAAPPEMVSETQVKPAFLRIAEEARRLASFFASQDSANPMIYRLNRLSSWITVDELPVIKEGRTLLSPPEQRLCDRLVNLHRQGDFAGLLKLAEDEASRYLFWLDLHRISAEALAALGERFAGAAETVGRETAAFVGRLHGLEALTFSDGMGFADDATRQWLSRIMTAPASETPAGPSAQAPEADGTGLGMDEIGRLARGRKTGEAAILFQARLRDCRSGREKFLCRLEFVDALTHTSGGALIASQIDALLEDVDRYRLGEFDPALALRGMTIALKACRSEPGAFSKTQTQALLHRVAKIDMVEFLKQGG